MHESLHPSLHPCRVSSPLAPALHAVVCTTRAMTAISLPHGTISVIPLVSASRSVHPSVSVISSTHTRTSTAHSFQPNTSCPNRTNMSAPLSNAAAAPATSKIQAFINHPAGPKCVFSRRARVQIPTLDTCKADAIVSPPLHYQIYLVLICTCFYTALDQQSPS
jgi:hypothetical protein